MSKKKVNNKKKKSSIKKSKPCNKKCDREKAYGEPMPVKPLTYVDGELYPKLVFKQSLWNRFLRFLGLAP
jgi:hypothetical protein